MSVAPCNSLLFSSSVDGVQLVSATRVLSIGMENIRPAPSILNIATSSTTGTTISVVAQLNAPGKLFCRAFVQSATVRTDRLLDKIQLQNFAAYASSNNITAIVISNVLPSPAYAVHCLVVSPLGALRTRESVLASVSAVSTMCCKNVTAQVSTSINR